jgi:hypothetical protein
MLAEEEAKAKKALGFDQYRKEIIEASVADIQRHRFALVIGNAQYRSSPLSNPENDAVEIAAKLEQDCNFNYVKVLLNVDYYEMMKAIEEFVNLVNSPQLLKCGRVVFFYFSGHGGVASGKGQFLCPVEYKSVFNIGGVLDGNVYLKKLVSKLEPTTQAHQSATGLKREALLRRNYNIVVIDACRSGRALPQSECLLPSVEATLISFACQANSCAYDGVPGRNGNYTTCLLGALQMGKQMSLIRIFKNAQKNPRNGNALPSLFDNSGGDFVFLYDPSFKRQVEKIRFEILGKEGGEGSNVWSIDWMKNNVYSFFKRIYDFATK